MTKISIVIPALNEEKYLPDLLTSLTKQTRMDFDVIVVDGSSSDNTVAAARSFAGQLPNLQVHVAERAGAARQRNLGARAAASTWLAFVDADSVALPYFIERLESFIEERNPALFTTWFRPDSEAPGDALMTLLMNLYVECSFVARRPIAPGTLTLVRRDVFELAGGYAENLVFGEDYDLTRKILDRGIKPQMLRETLYEMSLRRVRKEGRVWFVWFYLKAGVRTILTKRGLEKAPAYVMTGGQYFETGGLQRSAANRPDGTLTKA
jgi:glycosyltransferase involved in cell wall biosynthesis